MPLEVAGEVRGVLNVDADRLEAFSAEDQELLEALAVQAADRALTIANSRYVGGVATALEQETIATGPTRRTNGNGLSSIVSPET